MKTTSILAIAVLMTSVCPGVALAQIQTFKLLADDAGANDQFGKSVGLSGITALIGAHRDADNGTDSGSAYLFDTSTGQQLFKLLPDDGAAFDHFGVSAAISGNTAIVGTDGDQFEGNLSGAAYLFDATTGQQLLKLLPDDGASGKEFGESVAISGNTALVGAGFDDDNGAQSGAAYLFDATTGGQLFKLLPDDGFSSDVFGDSVAISGNTALIGSPNDDDNGDGSGSAYLFDATTGQQLLKLLPDDGDVSDAFGDSVAISGNIALVGAPFDQDNGFLSGSAYLFDATSGQQLMKLLPDDGQSPQSFGGAVALSGNIATIGASLDDDLGMQAGAAYLFDVTTGEQLAKLLPDDGVDGDLFGSSLAISGNTILVASPLNTIEAESITVAGSAYVFEVVPEPSTALLGGLASIGLLVAGRRRAG